MLLRHNNKSVYTIEETRLKTRTSFSGHQAVVLFLKVCYNINIQNVSVIALGGLYMKPALPSGENTGSLRKDNT